MSVLSAEQEQVCSRFAGSDPDKFALTKWEAAPSGSPILDGAVAWIDWCVTRTKQATTTSRSERSPLWAQGRPPDHRSSSKAGTGHSTLVRWPLRIGQTCAPNCGSQTSPARTWRHYCLESYTQAIAGGELVVIAASGSPGRAVRTHIGRRLPFAAPFGSLFAAFDAKLEAIWHENGSAEAGSDQAAADVVRMHRVRERGWAIGLLAADHDELWAEISAHGDAPATDVLGRKVDSDRRLADHYDPDDDALASDDIPIRIIAAPVREVSGEVVQMIVLFGFPKSADQSTVAGWVDSVVKAAEAAEAVSADLAEAL